MGSSLPSADIRARRRYLTNPQTISITKTTATTCATALTMGMYTVYATNEWYFIQGSTAAAATNASWLIEPYEKVELYSSGSTAEDAYVSGLAVSDSCTVYIGRLS